jgi:hypothetical protein
MGQPSRQGIALFSVRIEFWRSTGVSVVAIPAPVPQIMSGSNPQGTSAICQNGTIAQSPLNVYVGQKIAFTGCVPLSVADLAISESWSPTPPTQGTAIASFVVTPVTVGAVTTYQESITDVSPTVCGTTQNCDFNSFYWTQSGSYTLSFTYILINGKQNSSTVTFNVSGPTGSNMIQTTMNTTGDVQIQLVGTTPPTPKLILNGTSVNGVQVGIEFTNNATSPAGNTGTYSWVQVLNSTQTHLLANAGLLSCPLAPQSGLDNFYPYPPASPTTTNDSPNNVLTANLGELQRSFNANMYLMWKPTADPACTDGASCTIPVPLGSVNWGWSGDAINTLSTTTGVNGTTWKLSCGTSANAFQASSAYPRWNNTVINGNVTCQ